MRVQREAFVGCLPTEGSAGTVIDVAVLPLLQLLGEQPGLVDDLPLEETRERLAVDALRGLHFAVEPWYSRLDVDTADTLVEDVPVQRQAELLAIIGLDPLHDEGKLGWYVVDELDGRFLVVARLTA